MKESNKSVGCWIFTFIGILCTFWIYLNPYYQLQLQLAFITFAVYFIAVLFALKMKDKKEDEEEGNIDVYKDNDDNNNFDVGNDDEDEIIIEEKEEVDPVPIINPTT